MAETAETIYVHPNPNDDGYDDNWVCNHIDMQTGKADGDVWLCEACADLLDAGAKVGQGKPGGRRRINPLSFCRPWQIISMAHARRCGHWGLCQRRRGQARR